MMPLVVSVVWKFTLGWDAPLISIRMVPSSGHHCCRFLGRVWRRRVIGRLLCSHTGSNTRRVERVQEQRDGGARIQQAPDKVSITVFVLVSVCVCVCV